MALANCRRLSPLMRQAGVVTRMSSTSFAEMYRDSVSSIAVKPGDKLVGHVVGQRRPRSASSQFSIIDFGLKAEAPFSKSETPGLTGLGDAVTRTVVDLEDDFNEPSFDAGQQSELPAVQARRYRALTSASSDQPQFLYGRLAGFKRGGATNKVLGFDAFSPRHHVLAISSPAVGSHMPLYLLSLSTSKRVSGDAMPGLDANPIVSSYGGILFSLANLVGFDDLWAASGGGSAKERLSYLRLLTRVLYQKNASVRHVLPRGGSSKGRRPYASSMYSNDKSRGRMDMEALRLIGSPDFARVWRQPVNNNSTGGSRSRTVRRSPRPPPAPRPGARPFGERHGLNRLTKLPSNAKNEGGSDL